MTKANGVTRKQALVVFGWLMLGLLALFIGALRFLLTEETVRLWWYADRYVPGELEVTRLWPKTRRTGSRIEGVIHPGGEAVLVASYRVVDPDDGTGLGEPTPGQLLAVWYWPKHADVNRWWHPSTVVRPGATQRGEVVARALLSWVAFGLVVVLCFRRAFRQYRLAVPPGPGRTEGQATPAWVGFTLVLLYVGVLGLAAYLMSR